MLLLRFRTKEKDVPLYGIWREDHVTVIVSSPFEGMIVGTSEKYDINDIIFLPPCTPSKIIGVGLNCEKHAQELNMQLPDEPLIFLKAPSSLIPTGTSIQIPEDSTQVDYEAELAVIISQEGRNIPEDKAKNYILGYTCANDVTARDIQKREGQWSRAKSYDTFCPLGPFISTDLNPLNAHVKCIVNSEVKQDFMTSSLNFNPYKLVSFISRIMTLKPGDVILTGTSVGVGPLKKGDTVTVEIDGIGRLTNSVI